MSDEERRAEMNMNLAVARAAAADQPQLRRAYSRAVAHGCRNTQCSSAEERAYGLLRLLTLALLRLPDLAVLAHVLHLVCESDESMLLARTMGEVAAGTLRLSHRALEIHARDLGYATDAWIDRALLVAGVVLDCQLSGEGDEQLVALEEARSATVALTRDRRERARSDAGARADDRRSGASAGDLCDRDSGGGMTERLLRALERLPAGGRRGVMVALPLLLLAAVIAAFALASSGPGVSSRPAASSARLLPPASTTATNAPGRPARPGTGTGRRPSAARTGPSQGAREHAGAMPRRPARGPVSEQPPPPPPRSPERTMLTVARRFAVAYMPYQVGRLPGWARAAIKATCTPAFARYLLAQPAQLTPLQAAHPKTIETYRVASIEPAGAPDTVAVTYISEQDTADTGEFLLRLVKRTGGGWLRAWRREPQCAGCS